MGKSVREQLLEKRKQRRLIPMPNPSLQETKVLLQKMDNYEVQRPEPHYWIARTWEDHKTAVLKDVALKESCAKQTDILMQYDFTEFVKHMDGASYGRPVDFSVISSVEHTLHVKFAEEFRTYLSYYGEIKLCDTVAFTGIDIEADIVGAMDIYRESFPKVPKGSYPVCIVDSDKTEIILYVQDEDGCIYAVAEDKDVFPVCLSLQELVVLLWYRSKVGQL